jgi:hypothetical protein
MSLEGEDGADPAEVLASALERPRRLRILETGFRPMTEGAWG